QTKEMGTASVRLLEAIILLCPKLFLMWFVYEKRILLRVFMQTSNAYNIHLFLSLYNILR
ncbi:hypothetical protein, partial [Priestia flexa]